MPWRKNTLSTFGSKAASETGHSDVNSANLEPSVASGLNSPSGFSVVELESDSKVPVVGEDESIWQAAPSAPASLDFEPYLEDSDVQLLDSQQFGRLISNAFLSNITMPWESDVAKQIFSDDSGLDNTLSVPPLLHHQEMWPGSTSDREVVAEWEEAARGDVVQGAVVFFRAVKNTVDISELDKRKNALESACMKSMTILEFDYKSNIVVCSILEKLESGGTLTDAFKIVEAVIGVKSPYTATSRANFMAPHQPTGWCRQITSRVNFVFLIWLGLSGLGPAAITCELRVQAPGFCVTCTVAACYLASLLTGSLFLLLLPDGAGAAASAPGATGPVQCGQY